MTIFKLTEATDSADLFDTDPVSFGDFNEDALGTLIVGRTDSGDRSVS